MAGRGILSSCYFRPWSKGLCWLFEWRWPDLQQSLHSDTDCWRAREAAFGMRPWDLQCTESHFLLMHQVICLIGFNSFILVLLLVDRGAKGGWERFWILSWVIWWVSLAELHLSAGAVMHLLQGMQQEECLPHSSFQTHMWGKKRRRGQNHVHDNYFLILFITL